MCEFEMRWRMGLKKKGTESHLHVGELARDDEAIMPDEGFPRCADSALAVGSEGDVGGRCVAT